MTQYHKSISFPKTINKSNQTKVLKLAFNESYFKKFEIIKSLDSSQIRSLLNNKSYEELEESALYEKRSLNNYCTMLVSEKIANYEIETLEQLDLFISKPNSNFGINKYSGTFKNNKNKGIFNWYPYIEGFSFDFVEEILKYVITKPNFVYDPFGGTGTTVLVASLNKIKSGFSEVNPLMKFLVQTKINSIRNYNKLIKPYFKIILAFFERLQNENNIKKTLNEKGEDLVKKGFFNESIILQLSFIKESILLSSFNQGVKDLLLLALSTIIVKQSNMIRRADLRYKKNNEFNEIDQDTISLFIRKTKSILNDLVENNNEKIPGINFISANAKQIPDTYNNSIDLIITSPPYVNGTNYFRNTKLELLFLDLIKNEDELKYYRTEAITAGINNVSKRNIPPNKLDYLQNIIEELEKDAYDSRIPKLVEYYFSDMKTVFRNIARILTNKGCFFIDIGDSKFKNIHIPTDNLFELIAKDVDLELIEKIKIRNRYSKDGYPLGQWLLHFKRKQDYIRTNGNNGKNKKLIKHPLLETKGKTAKELLENNWEIFRDELPYRMSPYSKRNWGNGLHSLCSYQGKLKPAIGHFLIKYFTEKDMTILDPLAGVGTIPFEASLQNRKAIGNDLSLVAYANTFAKIGKKSINVCVERINDLENYIKNNTINDELIGNIDISFNKNLVEYYHKNTIKEILLARDYFKERRINDANDAIIFSSLLHILHGNRPYALSRTSHPITPFAPKGEYIYKNLIKKLNEKIRRSFTAISNVQFQTGNAYYGDFLVLDEKVKKESVDSIITSPPFFDSTKFYLANWIRLWFAGWDKEDFEKNKVDFLESRQVKDFSIYDKFFKIAQKLLKKNGSLIMHLGASEKANMAEMLIPYVKSTSLDVVGYFNENVSSSEKFGISDQGSVKSHQFLFITK